MSKALKERLDTVERTKLRKLEATVAEGIASFVVVGEALKEIRDAKLYRESHKTFEKYVDDKWGFEKRHAYRLIDASETSKKLCPTGSLNERVAEIKTERQLRELRDVPAESIEAVVNKAADIAGDERITASDIKQAREEVLAPEAKPEPPKDAWEDVVDEPEPAADARHETVAERASKMKSMIKQHNAAMMRTVDDLQKIMPRNTSHKSIHQAFREIHQTIEGWK